MLRRTEISLFGLYSHRSMLYSSTKVVTRQFVRHLENLRTTTSLFNDIYFQSRVVTQLGGCTVYFFMGFCHSEGIHRELGSMKLPFFFKVHHHHKVRARYIYAENIIKFCSLIVLYSFALLHSISCYRDFS